MNKIPRLEFLEGRCTPGPIITNGPVLSEPLLPQVEISEIYYPIELNTQDPHNVLDYYFEMQQTQADRLRAVLDLYGVYVPFPNLTIDYIYDYQD